MSKRIVNGLITKTVGGIYTVVTSDGVYNCGARGIFRKEKLSPCVGDNVEICIEDNAEPVIEEVSKRRNHIIRPPLSNLDYALLVTSTVDPAPNTFITDKLISIFENNGIEPVIIATKNDIESADGFISIYKKAGFNCFCVDNKTGDGVSDIVSLIKGKISALIGNSGAGKSSLMNNIFPDMNFDTGEISKKLGRGRHTTRTVELFELSKGGYIADTPGFSTVEVSKYGHIPKKEIQYSFREFSEHIGKCRFHDCCHIKESGCKVIEALENGDISKSRYESYIRMYSEAEKLNDWEFK